MKRKQYAKELKAKIALEAIKGHKTVNELAAEFEVHPTQISQWKKQALESLPLVFGNTLARRQAALDPQDSTPKGGLPTRNSKEAYILK